MDPIIVPIETEYDRFIQSIADHFEAVDSLRRIQEEVTRVDRNLSEAETLVRKERDMLTTLLQVRDVPPPRAEIEIQKKKLEEARTKRNDRQRENSEMVNKKNQLELKKAKGLQHFRDRYEIFQTALDNAESFVQLETRRLEMSLHGASAALFNGDPHIEFDMTDTRVLDSNLFPQINDENGRPAVSREGSATAVDPPPAAPSEGPTDSVNAP